MNLKIVAATLGVIAVLAVPVFVAANAPGDAAGTQEQAAVETCVCAGDCEQDQLMLRDGCCGGNADCLQKHECAQDQLRDQTCANGGNCTQDQTRDRNCDQSCTGGQDQTCANGGNCAQNQMRSRDCGQTCMGGQDQTCANGGNCAQNQMRSRDCGQTCMGGRTR